MKMCRYLLLDDDKPCGDDRPLRTTATPASSGGWNRSWRLRWRRTALRLKEIHIVCLWIHCDCLRASKRRNGLDNRVFVWRILVHDCDVAFAPVGNVDQFLRCIPSQSI